MYKLFLLLASLSTLCSDVCSMSLRSQRLESEHRSVVSYSILKTTEIQKLKLGKETKCCLDFIIGDYASFSKMLDWCVWLGFSSHEEYASADFKIITITNSGVGTFSLTNISTYCYEALYPIMLSDITVENDLKPSINPDRIRESPIRDNFTATNNIYGELIYEMLLLRAQYIASNEALGSYRFAQVRRLLNFQKIYEDWKEFCDARNALLGEDDIKISICSKPNARLLHVSSMLVDIISSLELIMPESFVLFKKTIDEGHLLKAIGI